MTARYVLRHILVVLFKDLTVALISMLLCLSPALGHELLDAERGETYLNQIRELNAAITQGKSIQQRAEALFALGETVTSMVESLNRDLVSHHGELGLASTVIMHELKAQGIELTLWPEAMRYKSYTKPFEQYLAFLPEGPRGAEALFHILKGRFYDSFIYDPLQPVDLDWPVLVAQIKEAEAFLARYPDFRNREEAFFILAVDYVRAARQTSDANLRAFYVPRARNALQEFFTTYPDSVRASAAQMLLARLPSVQ